MLPSRLFFVPLVIGVVFCVQNSVGTSTRRLYQKVYPNTIAGQYRDAKITNPWYHRTNLDSQRRFTYAPSDSFDEGYSVNANDLPTDISQNYYPSKSGTIKTDDLEFESWKKRDGKETEATPRNSETDYYQEDKPPDPTSFDPAKTLQQAGTSLASSVMLSTRKKKSQGRQYDVPQIGKSKKYRHLRVLKSIDTFQNLINNADILTLYSNRQLRYLIHTLIV